MVGERLNSSQKLVDQGEKGVYSSYTRRIRVEQNHPIVDKHTAHNRSSINNRVYQLRASLMQRLDFIPVHFHTRCYICQFQVTHSHSPEALSPS